MLRAEGVSEGCRKEREDFAPAEKDHPGEQYKQQRIVFAQQPQRHRAPFQTEGDKHHVFAPNAVRDIAAHRAR